MPKVLYEKDGKIAYVTINRPEVRNSIDPEAHRLMWEIPRRLIRSAQQRLGMY